MSTSRGGSSSRLVRPNRSRNSKLVPYRNGRPGASDRPSSTTSRRWSSVRIVVELGRSEAPGRPFLYGTSFEFLERFGLTSLDELPPLEVDLAARLIHDDEVADVAAALGPPVDIEIEEIG